MALTVAKGIRHAVGSMRAVEITLDFDDSYPTGGEPLAASDLGLSEVRFFPTVLAGGYVLQYDYDNEKLQAFHVDMDAQADSPLVEVTDSTDLEALTGIKVLVYGL